ncbi:MAG TPA: DUF805 domain-containing protein, partial [Gammaproteobacteria bacterium]|nr:DUF805 domain-containing protein [Gammaproteobacteria bacterium]
VPMSDQIRFFDYSSRIGRLRYFAYPIGSLLLALLPMIAAGVLVATRHLVLAGLLFLAIEVFIWAMSIVFAVRRLHDLNASGYWTLLYVPVIVTAFAWGLSHSPTSLRAYLFCALGGLVFALILLFTPGTAGDNRYGPPPPPNSGWVIAGAWSYVLIFFLGILAGISIPAYQDYLARSQTAEAIELAGKAEAPVAEYLQQHKQPPPDLAAIYLPAAQAAPGRYVATITGVAGGGNTYGVIATMRSDGVSPHVSGSAVEVWTTDSGASWHCGPASSNGVNLRYLPRSCRESESTPP